MAKKERITLLKMVIEIMVKGLAKKCIFHGKLFMEPVDLYFFCAAAAAK